MYTPYPHQVECLDVVQALRDRGSKTALIVMASGLGKTVTMAFDAKGWRERYERGRVLFLCHNNDILYQAKTTFEAVNGSNHTYGYFHGEEKHLHPVDFLFASFQTMEKHRDLFDPNEFAYIVVDESHHSQANTFRSTIEYFRPKFLLGATATPDRLDELDIREIFGTEAYYLPLEEAMVHGLVTPVDYRLLADEIQLSEGIETGNGRVSIAALNRKIFIPRRDEEIAKIIARHVSEFSEPRVIVFCNSIKHCEHLTKFIPDSFAIHSKVPESERAVKLEMFRQGVVGTVLTVDAFNEGIDIPQANVVVFLRSTISQTIFLQQLGRGLRKSDGKDKVIALDFVANCERIKMIHTLWQSIEDRLAGNQGEGTSAGVIEPMTLNVDSVEFTETVVPLLKLMERLNTKFYLTWQEASEAAITVGIKSAREYVERYREDVRLPSHPHNTYADFPGYPEFLNQERYHRNSFYPTWKQASAAAKKVGIASRREYDKQYRSDPQLPSRPHKIYSDFPGWGTFLGTGKAMRGDGDVYSTLAQASRAAKALGVRKESEYKLRYKEDPQLPSSPERKYKNFPGWPKFLGTEGKVLRQSVFGRRGAPMYESWQEASQAAIKLGIKHGKEYRRGAYKKDPKLPSSPHTMYGDFPGWPEFLSKK